MKYFLDTNIFLRGILNDHVPQSAHCRKLFKRIIKGELEATTTDLVVAEVVYVLEKQAKHHFTRIQIQSLLTPFLVLPQLHTSSQHLWKRIFELYISKNIDFIDAYNAVVMESQGVSTIYSYDRDFSKVSPLKRLEP